MIFNSFNFLWMFPLIFAIYWGIGSLMKQRQGRVGNLLLLLISYALYMQHRADFALVLLGVTAITFFSALVIEHQQAYGKKKYIIFSGALLALLPLIIFKYAGFVNGMLTNVMGGVNP